MKGVLVALSGGVDSGVSAYLVKKEYENLLTIDFICHGVGSQELFDRSIVYYENKKKITFDAIKADAKKIRFELAKVIRARTVPELNFVLDDSMEYGDKMDKLFKSISEGEKRD